MKCLGEFSGIILSSVFQMNSNNLASKVKAKPKPKSLEIVLTAGQSGPKQGLWSLWRFTAISSQLLSSEKSKSCYVLVKCSICIQVTQVRTNEKPLKTTFLILALFHLK